MDDENISELRTSSIMRISECAPMWFYRCAAIADDGLRPSTQRASSTGWSVSTNGTMWFYFIMLFYFLYVFNVVHN